jgi:anti-sigma factor RsiW
MINCVHFRTQWEERDRLDATDTMRMRRHLAACERCQAYDQQMQAERGVDALSATHETQ